MTIYYLCVRFTKETNQLLSEYRMLNGLSHKAWPKLGFHTTIIYSTKPFEFPICPLYKEPIGIVGHNAELWGTSLVLTYSDRHPDGSNLYDMYNIAVQGGAISDHPTYKPHITIVEDCTAIPTVKEMFIPVTLSEVFYMEW